MDCEELHRQTFGENSLFWRNYPKKSFSLQIKSQISQLEKEILELRFEGAKFLNNNVKDSLHPSHFGSLRQNKFILKTLRDHFDSEVPLIV